MLEDLIFDADPNEDLHLVLVSPGGDGETAVRLVRSAQARCRELSVIVPDQAKSAATLLAMGAHHILMGPTSDLGPVDPQFRLAKGGLVSAKAIIAAVDDAEQRIQAKPETFPLHASLLADVTSIMVQQAREELARTDELLLEALKSCPDRDADTAEELAAKLHEPLVEAKSSHGAIFSADDAAAAGLPVIQVNPASPQWQPSGGCTPSTWRSANGTSSTRDGSLRRFTQCPLRRCRLARKGQSALFGAHVAG